MGRGANEKKKEENVFKMERKHLIIEVVFSFLLFVKKKKHITSP